METRYRYDENQIVYEVLDQEVMLVNLDNGFYYALEGSASELWQWMSAGATLTEAVEALLRRFAGDPAQVEAAARDFVAELVRESLLTPREANTATQAPAIESTPPANGAPAPFAPPAMYRYTDMAKLIQMDPIRDFDETHWPRRRDDQRSAQP